MKGMQVVDGSNDKKYFSIIPNYIVNHSNHWEQSLYLVMKRLAGEKGMCFAAQGTLAKLMQCSQPIVSRTLQLLEKRNWIKKTGKFVGETHLIPEYEIVDLWKMNVDYYQEKVNTKPENNSNTKPQNSLSSTKHQTTELLNTKPQNTEEEITLKEESLKNKDNKYPKVEDVTETDLEEIAEKYHVPLAFVKSKYDDMILWVGERPNDKRCKGRNWRMTLMNWVKRDALKIMERRHNDPKSGIDARNI